MKPQINVNERDVLNMQEKLAMLALPPKKRFWILKTLGRWEIANVRRRIRAQKDINDKALEPRKGKKRGKVLKRMAKGLTPYVRNANTLDLTWGNKLTGKIAARHHIGQAQKVTAREMQKKYGSQDPKEPCTKSQARKLRELGLETKRAKGKGTKKPSLRWIMENISKGKAGLMIRIMKEEPSKNVWSIPLAERQILGSKEREVNRQLIKIFEQAKQRT
ncbi:virion morphogenesis protein [Vibrio harveyi]|uniref:virion morphogenesis protein n=1 Tax=Vibrio harveyi TaxID=669 RepID=UPI0031B9E1C1